LENKKIMETDGKSNGSSNGDKTELPKQESPLEINLKTYKNLKSVTRHLDLVQDACKLLAERIIDEAIELSREVDESGLKKADGEKEQIEIKKKIDFAIMLIANGRLHDNSKFFGIEREYLIPGEDPQKVKLAHHQHVTTNKHHPEIWGSLRQMPEIYIAEMVCDWFARSTEAGTDLRKWIKEQALEKYSVSANGKTYKVIKKYVDLLLDDPLTRLK